MPAVYEPETSVDTVADVYSTNDSHIHLDLEAPARRARLRLDLKPGETDEVAVPGTVYQCAQCNPNGTLESLVRPNNNTFDHAAGRRQQNEMDELRQQVRELTQAMLAMQGKGKKPAPTEP